MTMDWYRRYNGTWKDPKFKLAAVMAGAARCETLSVWDAILEESSESEARGALIKVDRRLIAVGLDLAFDLVDRIWDAFVALGMIGGEKISKWVKRQGAAVEKLAQKAAASLSPAALRQRKRREKIAATTREPEIPGLARDANQERDKRDSGVTSRDSSRTDIEEEIDDSEAVASESIDQTNRDPGAEFEEFWSRCPRKVGKGAARKAYAKARGLASWHTIMSGMLRYAAECDGTEPRFIKHPAKWLTAECWDDEPTPIPIEFNHRGADGRRPTLSRAEQRSLNNRRNLAAAMRAFEQRQQAA
jgi:hypothetical protein